MSDNAKILNSLSLTACKILKEASLAENGLVWFSRNTPGSTTILINGKELFCSTHRLLIVPWEEAMKELVDNNLLKGTDGSKRIDFLITELGHEIADMIQ